MTEQQPTEEKTQPEQKEGEVYYDKERAKIRVVFGWMVHALTTAGGLFIWVYLAILVLRPNSWLHPIMKQHFAAVFGIPIAATIALAVVTLLRISAGPLMFEVWGLKVSGAAGEALFWVLCFLSIVLALYTLY
jgi:hypothetical protein